ncbi:hypothetical protein ACFQ1E_17280 [Sphingomonas canadensis]|uniref:DUF2163 domain-containing protein n=1 Tax=Sphingomonas canadensis TaxID=1219257 RepID=A0ABW3HFN1_9SPHN|nr:hypothetical protein [Sphingomonas canadensis]MCW3837800.1 hypothetical protein [Sphingomonas canadensis]
MTALHPALDAALAGDNVTVFAALTIALPDETLRLLDGAAELQIGEHVWAGEVADLVTGWGLEDFEDGTGDEAPSLPLTLFPASDAAAAELSDPAVQGSQVRLEVGARNDATGEVIGEPYLLFAGEIDVPLHRTGPGKLMVDLTCVGGMEGLYFEDEGIRMAQSFHERVWPDELGFAHVTGITDYDYWGMKGKPNSSATTGGTSTGSGTGGGGDWALSEPWS